MLCLTVFRSLVNLQKYFVFFSFFPLRREFKEVFKSLIIIQLSYQQIIQQASYATFTYSLYNSVYFKVLANCQSASELCIIQTACDRGLQIS